MRYVRPEASNKTILLVSRGMVALLGGWSLYQSLGTRSVLEKALYAYTIYSAALTPVILAAFFWRRATAAGAVGSIAAGTVVTLFWKPAVAALHAPVWVAERDAILPALVASVVCLVVVSLLTRGPSAAQLEPFAESR